MITVIKKEYFVNMTTEEYGLLQQAYQVARKAHLGQKRKSGQSYITHPIAVARTLHDWGLDASSVIGGLLHDVIEDSDVTNEQIKLQFGEEISFLVEGVTKLGHFDAMGDKLNSASIENIRKLLLATSRDLRVILIKLADRLHNLQSLQYMDREAQLRIANESLEVYAPIADRLSMGKVKSQIEDLSFRYANPSEYFVIKKKATPLIHANGAKLDGVIEILRKSIKSDGIQADIESRIKHLYSIYKKLQRVDGDLGNINDLIAIRIIVDEIEQCYRTLGIVHRHYKPIINLVKDYIAVPKPNGYQSLHTTVRGDQGMIFEVQIRTRKMHDEAEQGAAAHYYYNQLKSSKNYTRNRLPNLPQKLNWVKNLLDWQENVANSQDLKDALKIDLFSNRIFIFSPDGDLYDLPEKSTPVDFAFALHTDIGLNAKAAKVNGQMSTLSHTLKNRDMVEILLTKRQSGPSRDWLNFVKTAKARAKIKNWFKSVDRDVNKQAGLRLLEVELARQAIDKKVLKSKTNIEPILYRLGLDSLDSICVAIGEGTLTSQRVADLLSAQVVPKREFIKKIFTKKTDSYHAVVSGADRTVVGLANGCCMPKYPQPIMGFASRNGNIIIHAADCPSVKTITHRQLEALWESEKGSSMFGLEITAISRVGLLNDITNEIAKRNLSIADISKRKRKQKYSIIYLKIEKMEPAILPSLIRSINDIDGVEQVKRR